MAKTLNRVKNLVRNGNGNGISHKSVQFQPNLEGLQRVLAELKPIVLIFDMMRIEMTEGMVRGRETIKRYAVRDDCDYVSVIGRAVNLRRTMLEAVNDALLVAFEDFDESAAQIRSEVPELLKEIEGQLAELQSHFRATLACEGATLEEKAAAYAAVNDVLLDALDVVETERRRRADAKLRNDIADAASVL
jgi:hypothetical protein